MQENPCPAWLHTAFDGRFIERAREAAKLAEVEAIRQRQKEIETRLKQELPSPMFGLILEWEELMNYWATTEREWLYYAGIKDGLSIWKYLLSNVSD